ncbi:MAG: hypothetical protein QOE65_2473 [Solirubrobacteraceae bacterium]|nr:hypothetical protein [Solirubrobacteraceae bacterium]
MNEQGVSRCKARERLGYDSCGTRDRLRSGCLGDSIVLVAVGVAHGPATRYRGQVSDDISAGYECFPVATA